jgi:hypothetical protein
MQDSLLKLCLATVSAGFVGWRSIQPPHAPWTCCQLHSCWTSTCFMPHQLHVGAAVSFSEYPFQATCTCPPIHVTTHPPRLSMAASVYPLPMARPAKLSHPSLGFRLLAPRLPCPVQAGRQTSSVMPMKRNTHTHTTPREADGKLF